ncbi:hypothetical protein SacxiDRAFT_4379 [Saccharomonospora xinjiangensis XJ-54]|uniref:Uncharacterized protein n=1 Tax=Saccharomonospora xinjiangensis XJ-54 TaxID=882086 RepID=I0V8V6_9PSEU|nr:hypothetical protein SacxiDRAFT_4379 [Saccharomonospora xinjiangensis XJ-54]
MVSVKYRVAVETEALGPHGSGGERVATAVVVRVGRWRKDEVV